MKEQYCAFRNVLEVLV